MRIGIDLGGTKIEAIALSSRGEELIRRRVPTPHEDYAATIAAIVRLVSSIESELQQSGTVGVGIPGSISPATGLVKGAPNFHRLIGQPLDRDLAAALRRPVRLANDANCFVLSEAVDGAGAGHETVFGVILGTGCGGGISVCGQIIGGANAIAGEWGHNALPWPDADEWPGRPCHCGKRGCIEAYLSGPNMAADHRERTGRDQGPGDIAMAAEAGDAACLDTMQRYETRLAKALATVLNLLDPDVIVLGGGLSNIESLYAAVPARWENYAFSDKITTPLRRAVHGDSSGVRGAAWLWPEPSA